MTKFKLEAVLPLSAEEFWSIKDSPEFIQFSAREQGLKLVKELERWDDSDHVYVKMRTEPGWSLPYVVQNLLGGADLAYEDIHTLPKSSPPYQTSWKTKTLVMPDKIKIEGTIRVEPITKNSCKQIMEGISEVSVWGVGSMITKHIVDGIRDTYSKLPAITRKYISRPEYVSAEDAARKAAEEKAKAEKEAAEAEAAKAAAKEAEEEAARAKQAEENLAKERAAKADADAAAARKKEGKKSRKPRPVDDALIPEDDAPSDSDGYSSEDASEDGSDDEDSDAFYDAEEFLNQSAMLSSDTLPAVTTDTTLSQPSDSTISPPKSSGDESTDDVGERVSDDEQRDAKEGTDKKTKTAESTEQPAKAPNGPTAAARDYHQPLQRRESASLPGSPTPTSPQPPKPKAVPSADQPSPSMVIPGPAGPVMSPLTRAEALGYIHDRAHGTEIVHRCRVNLIGDPAAGKTSLLRCLTDKTLSRAFLGRKDLPRVNSSTVGVDLLSTTMKTSVGSELNLDFYDMAGQTIYQPAHLLILSRYALHIFVWNMNIPAQEMMSVIESWMRLIQAKDPGAAVMLVGTHGDCIRRGQLNDITSRMYQACMQVMSRLFQDEARSLHLVGCYPVSCKNRTAFINDKVEKIEMLSTVIADAVMAMAFESGLDDRFKVPITYMQLLRSIDDCRTIILSWAGYKRRALTAGVKQSGHLRRATRFLHEWGRVMHFDTPALRHVVFLDATWVFGVMTAFFGMYHWSLGRVDRSELGYDPTAVSKLDPDNQLQRGIIIRPVANAILEPLISLAAPECTFDLCMELLQHFRLIYPGRSSDDTHERCWVFPAVADADITDLQLPRFVNASTYSFTLLPPDFLSHLVVELFCLDTTPGGVELFQDCFLIRKDNAVVKVDAVVNESSIVVSRHPSSDIAAVKSIVDAIEKPLRMLGAEFAGVQITADHHHHSWDEVTD